MPDLHPSPGEGAGGPTRRSVLRAAGLGLAAVAPLSACGGSAGAAGRTTIRFQQNKPEVTGYFDKLIDAFHASQSRVRVIHDATPTSIVAQFVRGAPPDIACYNYNLETSNYVKRGVLTDLSDLPEATTIDPKYQSLVSQFATYEGQTSVLPYSVTAAGVIYNVGLFADHGIAVPTTWTELDAACRTFAAAGVTPIYGTYKDTWTTSQGLFDYTTGSDIDVAAFFRKLKADGTGGGSGRAFQDAMGQAVSRMLALGHYSNRDALTRSYADGNLAFGKGGVAMYLQGPWALGEIAKVDKRLQVGTFPLPATDDPATTRARVNLDLAVWIPRSTKKRDAAMEFLRFLMKPEVINAYNKDNLAFSPLKGGPAPDDARTAGLKPSLDANRIYQGAGTYIPQTIPLGNYLQSLLLSGNGDAFLKTLDTDWQRLAARSA